MKRLQPPPTFERKDLESMPASTLVEIILKQQEMIQMLFEEVSRLKEIISQDSRTTSKPPSSDIHKRSEKVKAPEISEEVKRKPGGQLGHAGKTRKGFDRVDRYELLRPEACPQCGGGSFGSAVLASRRHQVAQLNERPIEVVEYEQASCACRDCGALVEATMPLDVIPGQDLGVSLQAMLVWLGEYGHLSYEKQQEWLWEIGRIKIGIGTLCATTGRVAKLVTPQVLALSQWITHRPIVQVDESPWLVLGVKEWMWVFTGVGFCLFHAGDTRSRAELEQVLGDYFAGVLSSDDFSVYNGYGAKAQQKCLAHLLRHFKRVSKLNDATQVALADVFMGLIRAAFKHHQLWQQTQDRSAYDSWASAFKLEVAEALETWWPKAGYAAGLLLRNLEKKPHQWWYFLDHPEVPPDNNRSERALRLAVTKRKVCGGSRSMAGFADTATLLTVVQTCRAQGRSVLEFLRQAIAQTASRLALIPVPNT
jgi:transposase